MDFIKKYLSIIIPASIFAVALIFIILTLITNSGVAEQMDGSISTGRRVSSLASQVPSEQQPEVEKQYQDQHQQDADTIEQQFIDTTTRKLISYDIFPEPIGSSRQLFDIYGENYREAVEQMIDSLNAADAPSEDEISTLLASTGGRSRDEENDRIVNAFCKEKAMKAKVYASPTLLPWFDFWRKYKFVSQNIAVKDCWNSQVAYWVYKDIADTVKEVNKSANSILDAPVKRLVGINFRKNADSGLSRRASKGSSLDEPSYVTEENPSLLVADTFTTRKCDEDIDVIHFSVSVVLAVDDVPEFMRELSSSKTHTFDGWQGEADTKECERNQITILKFETSNIERDADEHKYYRYGDNAVIVWTAACEYIFSREAYEPVMPEMIRQQISGQEEE